MSSLEIIQTQEHFPEVDLTLKNALHLANALNTSESLNELSEDARKQRSTLLRGRIALNTAFYRLYPGREYRSMCVGANVFEVALHHVAPAERDVEDRDAYLGAQLLSHGMTRQQTLVYADDALLGTELIFPHLYDLSREIGERHDRSLVKFTLLGTALARRLEADLVG